MLISLPEGLVLRLLDDQTCLELSIKSPVVLKILCVLILPVLRDVCDGELATVISPLTVPASWLTDALSELEPSPRPLVELYVLSILMLAELMCLSLRDAIVLRVLCMLILLVLRGVCNGVLARMITLLVILVVWLKADQTGLELSPLSLVELKLLCVLMLLVLRDACKRELAVVISLTMLMLWLPDNMIWMELSSGGSIVLNLLSMLILPAL